VAVVEDELWSMLSTEAAENTFALRLGGHTVSVSLTCSPTAFATCLSALSCVFSHAASLLCILVKRYLDL